MDTESAPAISIADIMTKAIDVISVFPEMPLIEAAQIISKHNFDGVPVIDKDYKLQGLLTEYDLISKNTSVHLPTFQVILKNIRVFKKDQSQFQKEVDTLSSLKVRDVMNVNPLTLPENAAFEDAVKAFVEHHRVNPIPVVNASNRVIGVISRYDVLKPMQLIKSPPYKLLGGDMYKLPTDNFVKRVLDVLGKEYLLVEKASLLNLYIGLVIGCIAGILIGFILVKIF